MMKTLVVSVTELLNSAFTFSNSLLYLVKYCRSNIKNLRQIVRHLCINNQRLKKQENTNSCLSCWQSEKVKWKNEIQGQKGDQWIKGRPPPSVAQSHPQPKANTGCVSLSDSTLIKKTQGYTTTECCVINRWRAHGAPFIALRVVCMSGVC